MKKLERRRCMRHANGGGQNIMQTRWGPASRGLRFGSACSALALASAIGIEGALAQALSGDDEIIVSATRRDQAVLDIPQSIQAVKGEDLELIGANGVEEVVDYISNLNLQPGRKLGGGFNIRGVSELSGEATQFATVGLYYDETPISDGFFNFNLATFDLNRVEVLKGPQGTLYGEGSLGGTVRLIPNAPSFDGYQARTLLRVSTTKGGGEEYQVSGVVNAPLIEDLAALRVTASYLDDGGFIDTAVAEDFNTRETTFVRAALLLTPTDRLTFEPSFMFQDNSAQGVNYDQVATSDLSNTSSGPDTLEEQLKIYSLKTNYDFGWAELTSATSYFDRDQTGIDDDLAVNTIINLLIVPALPAGTPDSPATSQIFHRQRKAFTQELRLVSATDGPFSWIVGGFYRDRDVRDDVSIDNDTLGLLGDPRIFRRNLDVEYEQIAFFGEASYEITPRLTVTGGLRWFEETISGDTAFGTLSGITFVEGARAVSIKEDDVLFKGALSYDVSEDALVYAQFSQGVRPGGVNEGIIDFTDLLTPEEEDALATFGQDSTNNYEIGLKASAFAGRLDVSAAAFLIDWNDVQVDRNVSIGNDAIVNAGKARSVGGELEISARPSERFEISASLGVNDAATRGDSVINETSQEFIPDGADLPFAPNVSGSVFAQYAHPLGDEAEGFLRVGARHVGERKSMIDTSSLSGMVLGDYQEVDLFAGVSFGAVRGTFFVQNVMDERAELDAVFFNLLGDVLAGYVRNRPRTFGFTLEASF